jgi:competence protein ComEC
MKFLLILILAAPAAVSIGQTLDIYFIDVEGGAATLVVTPEKESVLMDAGWRREDNRDAQRIFRVATKEAGLTRIDYFITSHFHADHWGGLPALAALLPIGRFLDHGNRAGPPPRKDSGQWEAYLKLVEGKRWSVRPGDKLPLKGVEVVIVASDGQVLAEALPRAQRRTNPLCADAMLKDPDPGEDARSVAYLLSMGKFEFLNLGDLSWNKEHELACPENRVGEVDLYQVTMHGMPMSGAPQQVWSAKPAVAIVNNGPRKGGTPAAYENLRKSPGLQDIWQLHYSFLADKDHNTHERLIANLTPEDECEGHWLKVAVRSTGAYTVTNSRNGFSKTYPPR